MTDPTWPEVALVALNLAQSVALTYLSIRAAKTGVMVRHLEQGRRWRQRPIQRD